MLQLIKNIFRKLYYFSSISNFKKHGRNIHFSSGGKIVRPHEIEMGDNIYISNGFHISARNLKFGNNIMIGPYLVIECDNHIFNKIGHTMFELSHERTIGGVTIEDDVWIGANVTILHGVTIGEGSVVGAASVVTKDLPPYTVCVGIPCKPIKKRFSPLEMKQHLILRKTSKYQLHEISNYWKLYNL